MLMGYPGHASGRTAALEVGRSASHLAASHRGAVGLPLMPCHVMPWELPWMSEGKYSHGIAREPPWVLKGMTHPAAL